jgi:zinc protease
MRQILKKPVMIGLCALAALTAGCATTGTRVPVSETTLANGLRVIVREDHRSPVVVSQIWYRVGSMDEPAGLTGISHALEHMMFKGTAKLGPNEFSRIIAANGGRENAFTSYDYTAYFQQLEKSRLPVAFELEADRMRNLKLDPEEFGREIKVVMEERRLRTEDEPDAQLHEKFMHTAFAAHSYRNPIIGWMADLESMKATDMRDWYRRWYAPNNAILVVAGDVDPREVFALAQKHFGSLKPETLAPTTVPVEPPQQIERRVRVAVPAEVPQIVMGYHVPVARGDGADWEPYALTVLAGVLDGGDSARIPRDLVRNQKVAAAAGADYSMVGRAPDLFALNGTPAGGRTVAQLEAALREQVRRVREEPVSEAELRRIKAQVEAADVYGRDSVFNLAMQLGRLATVGLDIGLLDRYVERIDRVTAEQVRAVAQKYLRDDNLTVAILDPQPLPRGQQRAPARTGGSHAR